MAALLIRLFNFTPFVLFFLSGCINGVQPGHTLYHGPKSIEIYSGLKACKDCEDLATELSLEHADDSGSGTYTLTRTRVDTGDKSMSRGTWKRGSTEGSETYHLIPYDTPSEQQAVRQKDGTLRLIEAAQIGHAHPETNTLYAGRLSITGATAPR